MGDHRVTKTDKDETGWSTSRHRHVAALCLDTGATVPKAQAIAEIRTRRESYWTLADGLRAEVEVVERCVSCGTSYLRTDRDTTFRNNLLELPDCDSGNLFR